MGAWRDSLSDRELRARLEQRGRSEREARWLVQHRDDPDTEAEIDRELGE